MDLGSHPIEPQPRRAWLKTRTSWHFPGLLRRWPPSATSIKDVFGFGKLRLLLDSLELVNWKVTHRLLPYFFECAIDWIAGQFPDVADRSDKVIALSSEHGFPYLLALGQIYKGGALSILAAPAEGLDFISKGISLCHLIGASYLDAFWLTIQAQANAKLGLFKESLKCLDEAAHHIEKTNERSMEFELHRVRAEVLESAGHIDAAEQSYIQAQAVARRQSARAYEVRAAVGLARLWGAQGKREDARNLLAPIYGWFTEGFDTPVLQEAKALLEALESGGAN